MEVEQQIKSIRAFASDPIGSAEHFLLGKLSGELNSLAKEPWMTQDDLEYVAQVQQSLLNGEHEGTLRKALITTAICLPINNVPLFISLIGSAATSALAGENIVTAGLKLAGDGTLTAIASQALACLVMLASYPSKSSKEGPLRVASILPSAVFIPVPGHTIASNLIGSLTLQNPEEFYKLTILEGKRVKHYLKQALINVAEQYKGII